MSNPYFTERNKCPACFSEDFRTLYQKSFNESPIKEYLEEFYSSQGGIEFDYLAGATYHLCECTACGLMFQKEIPNDDLMKRLYEIWLDPYKIFIQEQERESLNLYATYAEEIMQIVTYLDKKPSSLKFFDFGMGYGKWALMAKAFGCRSYGSELSEARIEFAKENGINVISWDEIPEYQFDFINTEQVFEHIADPLQTLSYLKKALKPGGVLKISVPSNSYDIERRLKIMDWKAPKGTKNSMNSVAPLEHINCFRKKSLLRMAAAAGIKEVFIPLAMQYQYTTNWFGIKQICWNFLKPIYRVKRQNYCLFSKCVSDNTLEQ